MSVRFENCTAKDLYCNMSRGNYVSNLIEYQLNGQTISGGMKQHVAYWRFNYVQSKASVSPEETDFTINNTMSSRIYVHPTLPYVSS
jgi:hypothetical protein